jgi:hypothetical protein
MREEAMAHSIGAVARVRSEPFHTGVSSFSIESGPRQVIATTVRSRLFGSKLNTHLNHRGRGMPMPSEATSAE